MTGLDLDDLEESRDELRDAVMEMLELALIYPSSREEIVSTVFKLASASGTISRAIDAFGKPEGSEQS
jgi:uncharacterized protein Yka (UPF0111/DUF47 family)